MYATRSRKVKTTRPDARVLPEACLLGAYHPAHRLSRPPRRPRTWHVALGIGTPWPRCARALLRQQGYRVPSDSAESFVHRVQALPLPGRLLSVGAPLVGIMHPLTRQLAYCGAATGHPPSRVPACRACARFPASATPRAPSA